VRKRLVREQTYRTKSKKPHEEHKKTDWQGLLEKMPVQVSIHGCGQDGSRSGVMWGSMLRHMRMHRRRRSRVRMGMASMFAMVRMMPEDRQTRLVMMRMGMRACRLRGVCMGMGVTPTRVRMPERTKVG
jgi:hypothetical protein